MRCAWPRCGEVAEHGNWCAGHRPRPKRRGGAPVRPDLRRPGWRQRSAAVRQLPCNHCGLPAEVAHHVVPVSRGGDADGEVVPLCRRCHGRLPEEQR